MKTVYLIRHGESNENVTPVFQSDDSHLSERGVEQVKLLAARLKTKPFDVLVSSPIPRARETAAIIAEATGKAPQYSDLFVEKRKPSAIAGKPYADPVANKLWHEAEESLFMPGVRVADAENYDEIFGRVDAALELLRAQPEDTIAVVTHGLFLRTILTRVLLRGEISGEAYRAILQALSTKNTSITTLRFTDAFEDAENWRLVSYADASHLESSL